MDVYNQIKNLPLRVRDEAMAKANTFLNSFTKKYTEKNPAPPEEIQKGLEEILAEHTGGTVTASKAVSYDKWGYAAGLTALAFFLGYFV